MVGLSASAPIPPANAKVHTTACEYCPVACGYKVYTWPVGEVGGLSAAENALGVDYPAPLLSGKWISENMHNIVKVDGQPHHCVVLPDPDAKVVNVGGTHSVRGGGLAKKLYNEDSPTADRLLHPLLKVGDDYVPIPWDMATDLVAELSSYTIDEFGELAWGMKLYSYEYYENVFSATKLALGAIATPNFSPHHAPAEGDDVPGLSDTGIDAFGSAFADDKQADVIFIAGSDPYETKTVRFTTWQATGGAKIIYVDPRKTFTAAFAESRGGIHLQVQPGTDTLLFNSMVRYILEQGWEDADFISKYIANDDEIAEESKWRRAQFGRSLDGLKEYLFSRSEFEIDNAASVIGVSADKIRQACEMLTGGSGAQPKTMVLFEKGLYWSHNYENTAAVGNLGLVLGASGRPGRATGRMGGHQRGGQKGASYPIEKSPDSFEGHPLEMDTERWMVEGKTRFRWIIGTNWIGAMGASQALKAKVMDLISVGEPVRSADPEQVLATLKARMDAGGMVIVHQDIYHNDSTRLADIILPAATWGEENFARNNAERRLRLYEKFMDAPGEARPDWRIFADVAKKMGFEGFDWKDSNEIFEEAAPKSSGGRRNFEELVKKAQSEGVRGHDLLRTYGTEGIQTPIKNEGGELVGTERLHSDLKFKTSSGKANFVFPDWDAVSERNDLIRPKEGQLWVLNGRVNHVWNNMFDFLRSDFRRKRYPQNFLEISKADADERGIVSGDLLAIESSTVLDQLGNPTQGSLTAVAYVTDQVPPGVTFTYFLFPGSPANAITPADTSLQPLSRRYNFKFGAGSIKKIGTTDLAKHMSFAPRNIPPRSA